MSLRAGIIGGTGYGGGELLRLLSAHPDVEIVAATSRSEAGRAVGDLYPTLRGLDLHYRHPDELPYASCDVVFAAAPNGVSMKHAPAVVDAGARLIDLAADFRLHNVDEWKRWYGMEHHCPELLAESVYGLVELNREAIRQARIVGCPGCYPTSVGLGFAPLVAAGLIEAGSLVADCKSGVTGAGRGASVGNLHGEVSENFRAYKADGHRHHAEIVQQLAELTESPVGLTFVPHLIPMNRGIHSTLYARLNDAGKSSDLQRVFSDYYQDEAFIDVMPPGSHPETRSVRGSNLMRIAVHRQPHSDLAIVLVVEDNLLKGAAGQAVQAMNVMFDLPERSGLEQMPLAV